MQVTLQNIVYTDGPVEWQVNVWVFSICKQVSHRLLPPQLPHDLHHSAVEQLLLGETSAFTNKSFRLAGPRKAKTEGLGKITYIN